MSIIALIHHRLSPLPSYPIIVSDMPEVVERDICQPQPPLTGPRSCTDHLIRSNEHERRASLPLSLSVYICLVSVICLVHRCERWLSGAIAITAYKTFSSWTTYRLYAALTAADLIRLDKNKLSVSLFVCLSRLVISFPAMLSLV